MVCSTFQNGCSNLGVVSDTIWSGTLSLLRVSIGLLFTKIKEKILIFHFVMFSNTFSFKSLSVFTLHCNILSWNLLKWPPYNAPLPDPPERNQDFENEKRSRPTTDAPLSDLNISYSLYAYAFTNSVFVPLFIRFLFSWEWACVALNQVSTGLQFHLLSSLFLIESHRNRSKMSECSGRVRNGNLHRTHWS